LQAGVITFDISGMTDEARELLKVCLAELITEELYVPAPYSEVIWLGKDIVYEANDDQFKILVSDKIFFGFVRFIDREDGWHVREFLPFDQVKIYNTDKGSYMPADYNIKKLPDELLMELHSEVHDEARIYSLDTKERPPEFLILKHNFIYKEIKHRNLSHDSLTELDRLSDDRGSIKNYIFLKEFFDNLNNNDGLKLPLISLQGECCVSGLTEKIRLNINWPDWDGKMIDKIKRFVIQSLPDDMKDKIEFIIDHAGDSQEYFVPFARLKIELIPENERRMIKEKIGYFRQERLKK
jgi:hypothetical protein